MSAVAPELDKLSIVTDDGTEFTAIESATVSSEFLTPCDSFEIEIGGEFSLPDVAKKFPMGAAVQIKVNDVVQMTGYVDRQALRHSEHGPSRVLIRGRDFLSPLVDGHIDPNTQVPPSTTIAQLCSLVVLQQFNLQTYQILDDWQSANQAVGSKLKRKAGTSRHKRSDPIKELRPHHGEGAFAYLARVCSHYGYWPSADTENFGLVIACPDYSQAPSYSLVCKVDPGNTGAGRGNNILSGEAITDQTNAPSVVVVKGMDSGSGVKTQVKAQANNPVISLFKPMYINDRDSHDGQTAETKARLAMSRGMREFFAYECEVRGFSDPSNGNIYNDNTVAKITDEVAGVDGPMWVMSRRFTKSRSSGTRTQMKLLPLGTLLLDWQPDDFAGASPPAPTDYSKASADVGSQSPLKTASFTFQDVTFFKPQASG